MKLESLHSLYLNQLRDLYYAENHILKALPKMIEATDSTPLRGAISTHVEQTKGHVARLEYVFRLHSEASKGGTCKAIEGIVDDGKTLIGHDGNKGVRDAAIVATLQKVEHYEIACYGSVRTWAQQLGHAEAAQNLQQTLDEEKQADAKMTEIAATLNVEAVRRAG